MGLQLYVLYVHGCFLGRLNRGQEANERELWTLKAAEAAMGIAAVALTVYLKCSYEHNKYLA